MESVNENPKVGNRKTHDRGLVIKVKVRQKTDNVRLLTK